MNATTYLKERFPTQHTFPLSQVLDLMNEYAEYKHQQHKKSVEKFQTEMFLTVHKKNIEGDKT